MDSHSSVHGPRAAITRRVVVEQAEAFLKDHHTDWVPLHHLCCVARVSERTLRTAFQEVRGVSPKRYMLRARLNEVREALKSGKPATVTDAATEHGFYELGRFASRYKTAFGESPSDTLRAHSTKTAAPC